MAIKVPGFFSEFHGKTKSSKDSRFEKCMAYVLFIASSLTPGTLIKNVFFNNKHNRATFINCYVFFKTGLSIFLAISGFNLLTGPAQYWMVWLLAYLSWETVIYNLTQIVYHDFFNQISSFKRNIFLSFANYAEIVFNFSIFYRAMDAVVTNCNVPPNALNWIDYLYVSMGAGGIISYGNYTIVSVGGKSLMIIQSALFILALSLFITFNVSLLINSKVSTPGK